MSPEQWTGGTVDARSDIYAVGLILFEMLDGSFPIYPSSIDEIVKSHLEGGPLRKLLRSDLDPELKQLLQGFLQPDSSTRISSWGIASKWFLKLTHRCSMLSYFLKIPLLMLHVIGHQQGESFLAVGASYVDIGQFVPAEKYFSMALDIARSENIFHCLPSHKEIRPSQKPEWEKISQLSCCMGRY